VVGSFKECQGAVKTFRAMVFGVGLGLKNLDSNRDSRAEPYPETDDGGWVFEAEQLKNRRVAELDSLFCKRHQFDLRSRVLSDVSRFVFAFSLPFHMLSRYRAGMPAPERNHVQVVRCKGIGCGRNVPIPVEVRVSTGSITVLCPVCLERRSYIIPTEVFMGSRLGKSSAHSRGGDEGCERQTTVSTMAHSLRCLREGHPGAPVQGAGDIEPIEHNPVIRCQHCEDTRQYLDKDCFLAPLSAARSSDTSGRSVAVVAGLIAAVKLARVESIELQNRSPRVRSAIADSIMLARMVIEASKAK
jgi:hypothetical protein